MAYIVSVDDYVDSQFNSLTHYGRKGMKWGKNIFTDGSTSATKSSSKKSSKSKSATKKKVAGATMSVKPISAPQGGAGAVDTESLEKELDERIRSEIQEIYDSIRDQSPNATEDEIATIVKSVYKTIHGGGVSPTTDKYLENLTENFAGAYAQKTGKLPKNLGGSEGVEYRKDGAFTKENPKNSKAEKKSSILDSPKEARDQTLKELGQTMTKDFNKHVEEAVKKMGVQYGLDKKKKKK